MEGAAVNSRVHVPYDRARLVQVLVHHQRHTPAECLCGWSELGASHAEHIADAYERVIEADMVALIVAVIEREGGRPGGSLHSWRCEWPQTGDPPCDCVEQVARLIAAELHGSRDG